VYQVKYCTIKTCFLCIIFLLLTFYECDILSKTLDHGGSKMLRVGAQVSCILLLA